MNRVTHFNIQADDFERAKKFYQNVFNWKFDQAMKKEEGMMDYWTIETGKSEGGINGGISVREKEGERKYQFGCTIEVKDIVEALKAVEDNGGEIMMEKNEVPSVGFFAKAKDTEGNEFDLMQRIHVKKK
jgi:predicted enzyme related to lactoylglutathione lyase